MSNVASFLDGRRSFPAPEPSFKIEKGVPLAKGSYKYPWRDMNPGDSFFVEGCDRRHANTIRASGGLWQAKDAPELRVVMRAVQEGQKLGYRFWLVERE